MGACDHASRGERNRVLVQRLTVAGRDPGGGECQRAAEGAAQVVALGQLALVYREQLARPG